MKPQKHTPPPPRPRPLLRTLSAALCVAAAFALTLAAGAVQGRLAGRWGQSVDLSAAAERLNSLPIDFGDWHTQADAGLSPEVVKILQCAGHVNRTCINRKTGDAVQLALLVGPSGPMSVHTPEVCLDSRNFEETAPPESYTVRTQAATLGEFWRLTMRSPDLMANTVNIYYAWNDGHGWQAPRQPRITYGGAPLLFKVQLSTHVAADAQQGEEDPCSAFLKEFLPVVQRTLFAGRR